MKTLASVLVALMILAAWFTLADAGTFTMKWDPSPGATSYDIEQSADGLTGWTLNKSVASTACTGTPVVCSTSVTGPASGVMHFRAAAVNGAGKSTRFSEGIWHCQSCAPPAQPAGLGVQ
jgi:hypothetical protein